jgi:hypothetical protein
MKSCILAFFISACCVFSAHAQLSSSPDVIPTDKGDLTIYPINHGSAVFTFDGKTVFADRRLCKAF